MNGGAIQWCPYPGRPPVGSAENSSSLVSRRSSQSSEGGQLRPAAEARSGYRLTLDWLMQQLRAISLCSYPRSYRNRNTSLIWPMDKAFWGICSSSHSRRNSHWLSNAALLLQPGKLDPGTLISMPVPTAGPVYSHPGTVNSHARNPYPHPPEYARRSSLAEEISARIAPPFRWTSAGRVQIRTLL
jgi:hypothetical protein